MEILIALLLLVLVVLVSISLYIITNDSKGGDRNQNSFSLIDKAIEISPAQDKPYRLGLKIAKEDSSDDLLNALFEAFSMMDNVNSLKPKVNLNKFGLLAHACACVRNCARASLRAPQTRCLGARRSWPP